MTETFNWVVYSEVEFFQRNFDQMLSVSLS